jgi:hypothetical protein
VTYGLPEGAGCGDAVLRGAGVPELGWLGVEFRPDPVVDDGEDSEVGAVSGVFCRGSDSGGWFDSVGTGSSTGVAGPLPNVRLIVVPDP